MKKLSITILLASFSLSALAGLTPLGNNKFADQGIFTIDYPCHMGGHILAIYGVGIGNNVEISSKQTYTPLYIANGYKAIPLAVSTHAQSDKASDRYLMVRSPDPASHYDYVHFGLTRDDNQPFYVDTINFATIYAQPTHPYDYMSMFQVKVDNNLMIHTFPETMPIFEQDSGVFVYKNVHSIEGYQYSWNQKGQWFKRGDARPEYTIAYRIRPHVSDDYPNLYNGYGFWICGAHTADVNPEKASKLRKQVFYDKAM